MSVKSRVKFTYSRLSYYEVTRRPEKVAVFQVLVDLRIMSLKLLP